MMYRVSEKSIPRGPTPVGPKVRFKIAFTRRISTAGGYYDQRRRGGIRGPKVRSCFPGRTAAPPGGIAFALLPRRLLFKIIFYIHTCMCVCVSPYKCVHTVYYIKTPLPGDRAAVTRCVYYPSSCLRSIEAHYLPPILIGRGINFVLIICTTILLVLGRIVSIRGPAAVIISVKQI